MVLEHLESYYPHEKLTLKDFSYKLVGLLAILSGQRCQTLHNLSLSTMKIDNNKCVFRVDAILKQSRKGKHLAPLEFCAFPEIASLCIVTVLKEYLRRMEVLRGVVSELLITLETAQTHKQRHTSTMAEGCA